MLKYKIISSENITAYKYKIKAAIIYSAIILINNLGINL